MSEGKSFNKAAKETAERRRNINNAVAVTGAFASYGATLLYLFPQLRSDLKSAFLTKAAKVINTKAVGGTLLKAIKLIEHLKMRKAGALFVKAKDVWISGDKLGG